MANEPDTVPGKSRSNVGKQSRPAGLAHNDSPIPTQRPRSRTNAVKSSDAAVREDHDRRENIRRRLHVHRDRPAGRGTGPAVADSLLKLGASSIAAKTMKRILEDLAAEGQVVIALG